jgi:spore cortex biosynthesis protein YabQ
LLGLWGQVWEFILITGVGIFLAVIFHFHQRMIVNTSLKGWLLWVIDFILWLASAFLVFLCLLAINKGDMRFYVILALITGGLLYGIYWKPKTNRHINNWAYKSATISRRIARKALSPLVRLKSFFRLKPGIDDEEEKQ